MSSSERLPPKYNRAKTAEFRVLRRSIDQKANRAKIVDRFRKLHEVSSELETVHESQAQPNPKVQGDKLQRWREAKEIKKKLNKKLEKPSFKICKVVHHQPIFLFSERHLNDNEKMDMRVTRSMAKISESSKGNANLKSSKTSQEVDLRKGTSKLVHGVISNKQCRKKPLTNKAMPMKKKPGTTLGNKVGKSQRLENDRCSFAPSNFVFTAPVGVQSYPLKQDSAITDALPSKIRTPSDKRNGENMTRKIRNDDFKSPIPKTLTDEQFSPLLDICPWITRTRGSSSRKKLKQIAECKLEDASEAKLSLVEEFNAIEQSETGQTASDDHTQNSTECLLTPSYFRCLLTNQTELLKSLCKEWSPYLENDDMQNEDVIGRIRTTIGQTELLIAERFHQFSNLIDDCEFERGDKPTTCQDLQGFWDMIYFQVEDVIKKFDELKKIKDRNFIESSPVKNSTIRKVNKKINVIKENAGQNKADNQRSQAAHRRLAEAKAKLALRLQSADSASNRTQSVPDIVVESDVATKLRRSARESVVRKSSNDTMSLEPLLPFPPLENLNIFSPRKTNIMRLSQLFSPLRDRTNVSEDQDKITSSTVSETLKPEAMTVATSFKKPSRMSNLIRFSEVCRPLSPTSAKEKENYGLLPF